jgi:hypothetical protein
MFFIFFPSSCVPLPLPPLIHLLHKVIDSFLGVIRIELQVKLNRIRYDQVIREQLGTKIRDRKTLQSEYFF